MSRTLQTIFYSLGLAGVLTAAGCISSEPPKKPAANGGEEHGHDHAHVHGPHNGHIIELGDEEYHAEWLHDEETDLVTVYILDKDMKETPVTADMLTITVIHYGTDGKATETPYNLLPANASEGDMPKASKFELTNKRLQTDLSAITPKAIEAKFAAKINGKDYAAEITHDEHHH